MIIVLKAEGAKPSEVAQVASALEQDKLIVKLPKPGIIVAADSEIKANGMCIILEAN